MTGGGRACRLLVGAGALLLVPTGNPASAHLLPGQHVTLNVQGRAVFGAFSIPVSALSGFDDDQDSRLSRAELHRHQAMLTEQVQAGIALENGHDAGVLDFLQLSVEPDDHEATAPSGSSHVMVLLKQTFTDEPSDLRLRLALFGTEAAEQRFSVRAVRQGVSKAGELHPRNASWKLFPTVLERYGLWLSLSPFALGGAWFLMRRLP